MLEIAAVLGVVEGARAAISEGAKIVESIKGFRSQPAKDELAAALQKANEGLESVGTAAEVAESYIRTDENVRELLSVCQRLKQFIEDNDEELDWRHPAQDASWRLVSMRYGQISEMSDAPRAVLLNRAEWYDARDEAQIAGKLQEFTGAFDRAKGYVESKKKDGVRNELEQMIRPLTEADQLLTSTLFDEILRRLQKLRIPSA